MEMEYIDEVRLMITMDRCVASVLISPEELIQLTDFVIDQVSNPPAKPIVLPDLPQLELENLNVSVDYGSLEIVVVYIHSAGLMLELILSPSEALDMCKAIAIDDGDPSKYQQYWCLPDYTN